MQREQKIQCHEMWRRTGLLEGIEDNFRSEQVAVILETQRLENERIQDNDPFFLRASIPLIRRVYAGLTAGELISLQGAGALVASVAFTDQYGRPQHMESPVKPVMTAVVLNGYGHISSGRGTDLEQEKSWLAETAANLANFFNGEVLKDLNFVTQRRQFEHKWKSPLHLLDHIRLLSNRVGRQGANWLVVSPNVFEELQKTGEHNWVEGVEIPEGLSSAGTISNKWKVFVDTNSENQILMGFKGGEMDAGYVYAPFSLGLLKDNGRIISRHAKKLIDAAYYARIVVNGYSTQGVKEFKDGQLLA